MFVEIDSRRLGVDNQVTFLPCLCLTSNDEIFLSDATKLYKYMLARQCPFPDILHDLGKVTQIDWHTLLSHTPKQQNKNICLITKFSPKIDHFIHGIKSNFGMRWKDWWYLCSSSKIRFQTTSQSSTASSLEYYYWWWTWMQQSV